MPGRLRGKVALIAGSTSGLGRACALRFAEEGQRFASQPAQAMCLAVAHWHRPSGELAPAQIAECCTELALAMAGANQPAHGRGSTLNARQGGRG